MTPIELALGIYALGSATILCMFIGLFIWEVQDEYRRRFKAFIREKPQANFQEPKLAEVVEWFFNAETEKDFRLVVFVAIMILLLWPVLLPLVLLFYVLDRAHIFGHRSILARFLLPKWEAICAALDNKLLQMLANKNKLLVLTTPSERAARRLHPLIKKVQKD